MKQKETMEHKAAGKNGVLRMAFVVLSLVLEIGLLVLFFFRLNQYFRWFQLITFIIGLLLVLVIYGQHKTSAMKMPWIILIMAAPVLGITLYFLIGLNGSTRKMRNRYKKIDALLFPVLHGRKETLEALEQRDPDAGAIAGYINNYAHYPVWQNTDVTYYNDAADGLEAQLRDLRRAERFIFMEYHAIEDKESWHRIEEVLVDRVHAGVEVRVFYDDMGSIGFINTDFTKKMERLGIQCRVFNPFAPGLNIFLNNRDHRKITVIDNKIGFTGGYNLANEYFNLTHPYGMWKDTGIRLEGDAVQSLTLTFLEMWNAVRDTDKDDPNAARFITQYDYHAVQHGFVQPYADSPMDDEHVGGECLYQYG